MAYADARARLIDMRERSLLESHAADARQRADAYNASRERLKRLHRRVSDELRRKGGRGKITIEVNSENREALHTAIEALAHQRRAWLHIEQAIQEKAKP